MEIIRNYIEAHKERFLTELIELLRIPSVSADPKYAADVLRTAEAVKNSLIAAGASNAEVCATAGNPIVYAEKLVHPDLPTVLVYGHYDVQPPDPLELWNSPPFEPVIKDNKIYARGACDDKGQFFMHVKALELMLADGDLPCNIKFMIEGEEEVGSTNLGPFLSANKEKLKADVALVSDRNSRKCHAKYLFWFTRIKLQPPVGSSPTAVGTQATINATNTANPTATIQPSPTQFVEPSPTRIPAGTFPQPPTPTRFVFPATATAAAAGSTPNNNTTTNGDNSYATLMSGGVLVAGQATPTPGDVPGNGDQGDAVVPLGLPTSDSVLESFGASSGTSSTPNGVDVIGQQIASQPQTTGQLPASGTTTSSPSLPIISTIGLCLH